uniref:Podocan-like n=1 Tax=Phallusia mammillata TaxID=59560 RepID=A0A6F9DNG5_9ASCI|nr:podocan-like [Phallusia mammillata]
MTNHIYRIPPHALARMPLLTHLYLSNNRLTDDGIPDRVFTRNARLKTLDLGENNLTSVPVNLPVNIEHLNLASNRIKAIAKETFLHTPYLKVVHLQDNDLLPETVSRAAFLHLRYLQRIDITWRPRTTQYNLPQGSASERHKRDLSHTWPTKTGWVREKCKSKPSACLNGELVVWPNRKRRRKVS